MKSIEFLLLDSSSSCCTLLYGCCCWCTTNWFVLMMWSRSLLSSKVVLVIRCILYIREKVKRREKNHTEWIIHKSAASAATGNVKKKLIQLHPIAESAPLCTDTQCSPPIYVKKFSKSCYIIWRHMLSVYNVIIVLYIGLYTIILNVSTYFGVFASGKWRWWWAYTKWGYNYDPICSQQLWLLLSRPHHLSISE